MSSQTDKEIKSYDFIIVGAGPAGIFAAYELIERKPDRKILILEKGKDITKRTCPVITKKVSCQHCPICAVMSGWGGAGAFSDGKLTYSKDVGGNLSVNIIDEYMDYVSDIYVKFGASNSFYNPSENAISQLKRKAFENNLKLYPADEFVNGSLWETYGNRM